MSDTYSDDEIAELFAIANPVPIGNTAPSQDRANHGASVAPNDTDVVFDVSDVEVAPVDDTRRERWWLVAGVAAAVALVVSLLVTTTIDDGATPADESVRPTPTLPEPERTAIPLIGADDDPDAREAFAIVESAFAAYNAGDMETWALWREAGSQSGADFAYDLATESRLQVARCEYRGVAEWDMDAPVEGHGFDCDVTGSDLFMRAAGVELEMIYNWVVAEDLGSSIAGSNEEFRVQTALMQAYRRWLAANRPDVESSIPYDSKGLPTAEGVPAAAEYIDEYVAQSDRYPLTEPVPPGIYGGPLEPATTVPSPTSTTAVVEPLAEIPVLRPGETRATPVGDITLTRVEGDATTLPQWVDFEYDDRYYGHDFDGTAWRSDDGVTWTQTNSLGRRTSPDIGYVEAGDQIWTTIDAFGADVRPQLLRLDDAEFVAVELPDLTEPDIPGLRPVGRSLQLTPFGGELAIITSTTYTIDFADGFQFGDDIDVSEIQIDTLDEDRLALAASDDPNQKVGPDFDVVVGPSEPGTVQFVSPEGTVVGRVGPWPGLDAEQLRQRLTSGLSHTQLLIGGDTGFEIVVAPRPEAVVEALADVDGQLLALTYTRRGYVVEQFSLWATEDLTTWTQIESPIPDDVQPLEVNLVGNGSGAVLAALREAWFTDDGQAWQPLDDTAHDATFAADFGWVMAPATSTLVASSESAPEHLNAAVSSDGIAWQHLRLDCPPLPDSLALPLANVVGNKIFVSPLDVDDAANRVICVGTVAKQ